MGIFCMFNAPVGQTFNPKIVNDRKPLIQFHQCGTSINFKELSRQIQNGLAFWNEFRPKYNSNSINFP